MAAIDDLTAAVTANTTAVNNAVAFIQAHTGDVVTAEQAAALVTTLNANNAALAAATPTA